MSTKDLLSGELPSDSESDDSDYVSEGEGSSSSSDEAMEDEETRRRERKSYKREIQRAKAAKIFQLLMQNDEAKVRSENHSDNLIDPLMHAFQQRQPKPVKKPHTVEEINMELAKYSNIANTESVVNVRRYKDIARSSLQARIVATTGHSPSQSSEVIRSDVEKALAGISDAKVEVQEEVRFAGKVVKLSKVVEKTSSHAARFERRKRSAEQQATGLGSFQQYLDSIKSHRGVTSVEKSATDWNQVKMSTAGMEEALKLDRGYLERQAFLARSEAAEDELRREARRRKLLENSSNVP
jgi:hypothetical protein